MKNKGFFEGAIFFALILIIFFGIYFAITELELPWGYRSWGQ